MNDQATNPTNAAPYGTYSVQRRALVTGASRGLGRAMALTLAKAGVDIAVNDIPALAAEAAKVVAEIQALGRQATYVPFDVTNDVQVEEAVAKLEQEFGSIDILVNNAGINRDGLMKSASKADWDAVIGVNLSGPFNCMKAVLPRQRERGWGRIINIASVVGRMGFIGTPYYAAAKAGLLGLTRAAAAEVARKGVTVNAVAPGYVHTQMTDILPDKVKAKLIESIPVGRFAEPDEIAAVVAFLASEQASYITGAGIDTNGGLWMA